MEQTETNSSKMFPGSEEGPVVDETHLCLVSEQPLPNLIPALLPEWNPRRFLLLVTPLMEKKGTHHLLRNNLLALGCKVDMQPIRAYRVEDIRESVLAVLADNEGHNFALNLTGGTKLMALGAYEVFRELGHRSFYVDTINEHLVHVSPKVHTTPLLDVVKVKTYLAAYGYSMNGISDFRVPREQQELTLYLVENAVRLAKAIGTLNYAANSAERSLQANIDNRGNNHQFIELIERFEAAGLLAFDGRRLVFANEQSRFFANGGWLESHVLSLLNRFKGRGLIRDHAGSLAVENQNGVRNEIDVAFTARNRLHLIECKTKKLNKDDHGAADIAYKLDSLRDLIGGTYGKALLVCYRQLREADRTRCHSSRIKVVEGDELKNLENHLLEWIKS